MLEEDYPRCKVEVVRDVEVMRCHIDKRKVRRAKPKTSCSRLPRKLCVKKACKEEKERCHLVVKMVREVRPEEKCKIRKKCNTRLQP